MAKKKPTRLSKTEQAGKLLHDEIGPLLSAAGLKLQLIAMDFPATAPLVRDVTATLDMAIDHVRALSRELHTPNLAPTPAPFKAKRKKSS